MKKDFCGPFWMPIWMRRLLSSKFNASCKIHDLDYDSKKFNRLESDKRFLSHMKRQCNSKVWIIIAYTYYFAVRIGGKISWKNITDNN